MSGRISPSQRLEQGSGCPGAHGQKSIWRRREDATRGCWSRRRRVTGAPGDECEREEQGSKSLGAGRKHHPQVYSPLLHSRAGLRGPPSWRSRCQRGTYCPPTLVSGGEAPAVTALHGPPFRWGSRQIRPGQWRVPPRPPARRQWPTSRCALELRLGKHLIVGCRGRARAVKPALHSWKFSPRPRAEVVAPRSDNPSA